MCCWRQSEWDSWGVNVFRKKKCRIHEDVKKKKNYKYFLLKSGSLWLIWSNCGRQEYWISTSQYNIRHVSYNFYNYTFIHVTDLNSSWRRTCGSFRDSAGPDECGGLFLSLAIRENMTSRIRTQVKNRLAAGRFHETFAVQKSELLPGLCVALVLVFPWQRKVRLLPGKKKSIRTD